MCFDFYFLVGPNFSSGWRDNLKQKKMRFFRSGWFFGELRELTAPPWSPWLEFQSQTIEFEGKIYRRINGVFNRFTDQATLFKNYITFWNNHNFYELLRLPYRKVIIPNYRSLWKRVPRLRLPRKIGQCGKWVTLKSRSPRIR